MSNELTSSNLAIANRLFRDKKYREAVSYYNKSIHENPELTELLKINIHMCAKRAPLDKEITTLKKTGSENIFIGIAAIPERESALQKTIESLISQVAKIGVYLNGWKKIPDFLRHEKIEIAGYQGQDLGDVGKFFWVDDHDGVYFTCDDDLVYPKDYVKRTIDKLKEYNYKAAIGWHGSLIKEPFVNYYEGSSRRVFVFSAHRPYDTPVHILGTGCCAFHTRELPIKKSDFTHPNMADIFFSIKGQEKNLPFIVIKHEKDEITEVEGSKESSIYAHSHADKDTKKNTREIQNKFVSEHKPWVINQFQSFSILIIGRFDSYTKGGIYKSCHLIKNHLSNLGHKVSTLDTGSEITIDHLSGHDICWIYPGDPERPDFELVDDKIKQLRNHGIPVLLNLSYLYESNRSHWITEKLKEYNSMPGAPVLAAVFTETAANDPILASVIDYVCVVPKTLLPTPFDRIPAFDEREGICLGDATKLGNPKVIGGSINPWIDAIHRRLPHVNLYAYKQYQGNNPHPKVKYISHMKENFGEWLAHRKLFICANVHLTFEMVACEAQQYGTPILYRHMPHSLSEYISATGMAVRTPEEMGEMVAWLYNNKNAWNKISKSSIHNASAKHVDLLDASLEGYLRLAIFRALRIKNK
jgi:glycosyltransferase involved in cell wall biosynthesis